MTKFARVLSDEYIDNIVLGSPITIGKSINMSKDFILMIEKRVLTKLAEQEPVVWTSSKIFGHYATHDTKVSSAEWFKEILDVPLYAHPFQINSLDDGTLINEGTKGQHRSIDNHIPDGGNMIPEGWQLVPIDPTEEMHNEARDWSIAMYGKAIGFEASHGCYKHMLAAAPRYTGEK